MFGKRIPLNEHQFSLLVAAANVAFHWFSDKPSYQRNVLEILISGIYGNDEALSDGEYWVIKTSLIAFEVDKLSSYEESLLFQRKEESVSMSDCMSYEEAVALFDKQNPEASQKKEEEYHVLRGTWITKHFFTLKDVFGEYTLDVYLL